MPEDMKGNPTARETRGPRFDLEERLLGHNGWAVMAAINAALHSDKADPDVGFWVQIGGFDRVTILEALMRSAVQVSYCGKREIVEYFLANAFRHQLGRHYRVNFTTPRRLGLTGYVDYPRFQVALRDHHLLLAPEILGAYAAMVLAQRRHYLHPRFECLVAEDLDHKQSSVKCNVFSISAVPGEGMLELSVASISGAVNLDTQYLVVEKEGV